MSKKLTKPNSSSIPILIISTLMLIIVSIPTYKNINYIYERRHALPRTPLISEQDNINLTIRQISLAPLLLIAALCITQIWEQGNKLKSKKK